MKGVGVFTVSLDFELHWGGFEKWPLENYKTYFLNTRQAIPLMLGLFEKYQIHVTWATVGILLHKTKSEVLQNVPNKKPSYKVVELSAYHYLQNVGIGNDEKADPFHFAPSLVDQIIETPFQELGSHTFAHYYCNEEGQTSEQFRDDLGSAQRVAKSYGRPLRSLVFPRNQFNDEYLKVCYDEGIIAVRSNPSDWFWNIDSTQEESLLKRFNRGLDAYFPIGKKNTYPISSVSYRKGFPVALPASRLLRPYNPKEMILNQLKISRIKSELSRAAKDNEVYHLWWHPHNFGNYPTQSLEALEEILKHYAYCRDNWSMQSLNMGELARKVIDGN